MKTLAKVERARRAVAIAIAVVSVSSLAYAQEQDPPRRDRGQRGGFERGQFDPSRMQEMMLQRLQRVLGMEDDEWQVVSPLLAKVMEAQGATRMGGMGGMLFGRGGGSRGGPPRGRGDGAGQGRPPRGDGEFQGRPPREGRDGPQAGRGQDGGRAGRPGGPGGQGRRGFRAPPSPEIAALNEALQNEDTPPDEIRAKMAAVRVARTRNELELKNAREELRQVLTIRQEARLVTMGFLD